MSRVALITKAEAKRLAEAANATGCAVEVESKGKVIRFVPAINMPAKPVQVDDKGKGYL